MTDDANLHHADQEVSGNHMMKLPIKSTRYNYYRANRYGMSNFVKSPKPAYRDDKLVSDSLKREYNTGHALNHPGIAKYLDFENNSIYEEFIKGETIQQMIEEGDPRLRDKDHILAWARQLFEVLDYMHSLGVVHRNISTDNVMISRVGNSVKLVDFSKAKTGVYEPTLGMNDSTEDDENGGTAGDIYQAGRLLNRMAEEARVPR